MNTTNNIDNKMQWYIDSVNNGSRKIDTIASTNRNFGTIVMPTGYGKSGYIFDDCIYNIRNKNSSKKLIICICSHILNLNVQTFTDFLNVLGKCNNVLNNYKLLLVLNSSDETRTYEKPVNDNINNNIEIHQLCDNSKSTKTVLDNFENSDYDIALVSSCNKSLYKFINNVKINKKKVNLITYIDECHTVIDNTTNLFSNNINFDKLVKNSYKLYGFSATPSNFVKIYNNIINKNKLSGKINVPENERIVNISADNAIKNNIIVKPYVKYYTTPNGIITDKVILDCMNDAIKSKNTKNNKLLVTCFSRQQATELYNKCSKYYKCFKNTSDDDYEINDFCNKVDSYNDNCIIFHCRKLIQGIDIKSISDCIIVNNTNGDGDSKNRIIQIIGRCLRTNAGERGKTYNDRIKKFANVYIVSNGNDEYNKNITSTIVEYYGIDNILYDNSSNNIVHPTNPLKQYDNNTTNNKEKSPIIKIKQRIDELKINLQDELKNRIIPVVKELKMNGGYINLNDIYKMCNFTTLSTDINTLNLFNETNRLNVIKNVLKQNNIDI